MMPSYDREYVDRVLAELEGDLSFAAARQRLLFALTWRAIEARSPGFRFVRWIDGSFLARLQGSTKRMVFWKDAARAVTPFGWRWEFVFDRDVIVVMPAWVYYPRRWWQKRWRAVMPFIRTGFWSVEAMAPLWSGRWRWRWWLGRYPQFRIQHSLPTRFDRLGLWLERWGKR